MLIVNKIRSAVNTVSFSPNGRRVSGGEGRGWDGSFFFGMAGFRVLPNARVISALNALSGCRASLP